VSEQTRDRKRERTRESEREREREGGVGGWGREGGQGKRIYRSRGPEDNRKTKRKTLINVNMHIRAHCTRVFHVYSEAH